eukprot:6135224-Alexandrium_andersonii.AAC.1
MSSGDALATTLARARSRFKEGPRRWPTRPGALRKRGATRQEWGTLATMNQSVGKPRDLRRASRAYLAVL